MGRFADLTATKEKGRFADLAEGRPIDEHGPIGDMVFMPKEPEGAWKFDKQLDDLFSGEIELEDMLPLNVRYDFGKIVGMTSKPDEMRAKMTNSLYYSVQLGIPPKMAFSITDQLNEIWFGKKTLPLQPGRLFAQSFIQSMADKPAMMLKGVEVYTPGEGKVDKFQTFVLHPSFTNIKKQDSIKDKYTPKQIPYLAPVLYVC